MKALKYDIGLPQNARRILLHLMFWIVVTVYYTFFFGHQGGYYWYTYRFIVIFIPITMGTTYFFNYFLIPRYLLKKQIWTFALFSFYTFVLSFYLISLAIFPFLILSDKEVNFVTLDKSILDIYFLVVGLYTVILIAVLIKLLKYSFERQNASLHLQNEMKDAELKMLRMQINPHFLFNTLNSIYTLSLKKSDRTPEVVLKLSEMLNYLLYECNAEFVMLEKEIEFIRNYMYLQQIRFDHRLMVKMDIQDGFGNDQITPNLLMPFIENSFKHGVGRQREQARIYIQIKNENHLLVFCVKNTKPMQSDNDQQPGGIGIKNVQRRLKLLYSDKHSLSIEDKHNEYIINLDLDLSHEN